MTVHTPRSRPLGRALVGIVVGLLAVLVAAPAWAHDELLSSDPAADEVVTAVPGELTMTFSGVLIDEPGANRVSVLAPDCTELAADAPVLDGTRVTQALTSASAEGTYTVRWRVVSSDGHPISDEFTFVHGAAGEPCTAEAGEASPDAATGVPLMVWIGGGIAAVAAIVVVVLVARAASRRSAED